MTEGEELYLTWLTVTYGNLGFFKERSNAVIAEMNNRHTAGGRSPLPGFRGQNGQRDIPMLSIFKRTSMLLDNAKKALYVRGSNLQKISNELLSVGHIKRHMAYMPSIKTPVFDYKFHHAFTLACAYNIYTIGDLIHQTTEEDVIEFSHDVVWIEVLKLYAESPDKNVKILGTLGLNLLKS